jgi:hypothetical protein
MKLSWKKILFFLLAPVYITLSFFLHLTFEWWEELYNG